MSLNVFSQETTSISPLGPGGSERNQGLSCRISGMGRGLGSERNIGLSSIPAAAFHGRAVGWGFYYSWRNTTARFSKKHMKWQ